MYPPSDSNGHTCDSNRFGIIFPDLDNLKALTNPQLFKMSATFGEVKDAFKSKVSTSA